MYSITLRKGREARVALGHQWVFSNEIQEVDPSLPAGEDVLVRDSRGTLLGTGTWSPRSLICVRLHARGAEVPLGPERIRERVLRSWEERQRWFGEQATACRAVFAEGDGLPGLIVDRFGDYLAVQCLTAGMDRRVPWVLDALREVHAPQGVLLRNDTPAREHESLPRTVTLVAGRVPERVAFELHGLRLAADLWKGQKTGFFFDQRENYALIRAAASGARVLDTFCYSGAWGLHALRWGAREVTFVDASGEALELSRENCRLNGFSGVFEQSDVLELLKASAGPSKPYDIVILDPPAFAKSKARSQEALRGYLNVNKWAMRCVRPGGYLATCSCSHHVSPEAFMEMIALAAREAGRQARVLGIGRQAPDHPWIPAMPETAYLKALLLQLG